MVRARPGFTERTLIVMVLFLNQFGTPARWFLASTGSASGPESDPLLSVGTLVLVGILSFGLVGNGDAALRVITAEPLLPLFLFLIGMSALWSDYLSESINGAANILLMAFLGFILLVRFHIHEILSLSAIAMSIGILMDLVWVLLLGDLGRTANGWDGLGTQKNELGGHTLIALFVFLVLARRSPRYRILLYLLAVISGILLVGSQSKTSLAAGILTVGSMLVFMVFRARKTMYGAVVITLAVSSVTAVLFVTAKLAVVTGWLDKDVTLTGRTSLWSLAIEGIKVRPWLGHGQEGFFRGPFSDSYQIATQLEWGPTHAHNAYLQTALHVGLIGAVIYIIFNLRALARATDHARWVPGIYGLFPLVYLTLATMISFTESGVFSQRYGLILFVVAVVQARLGVEEVRSAGYQRLDKIRTAAGLEDRSDKDHDVTDSLIDG